MKRSRRQNLTLRRSLSLLSPEDASERDEVKGWKRTRSIKRQADRIHTDRSLDKPPPVTDEFHSHFFSSALQARHISQSSSKSTWWQMSATYLAVLHSIEPMRTTTSCTEDRYYSTTPPASTNDEGHRLSQDVCPRNDESRRTGYHQSIILWTIIIVSTSTR